MFELFSHYLSYGATDQQTARALEGFYDGLLVPGTVAAFQREGTKGFVLTLSASRDDISYAIDSRFPLFQNQLPAPKKSHLKLAEEVLGRPDLVHQDRRPVPSDFPPELCEDVARAWLEFNTNYTDLSTKHFDKYAKRLRKAIVPAKKRGPSYILPPYVICGEVGDGWDAVSNQLWTSSVEVARSRSTAPLVRVYAADSSAHLASLLTRALEPQIAIWVSGLSELEESSEAELVTYARAIQSASLRNIQPFALYGGFFAVLMSYFGLSGASHGIGYGESRDWVELPQSGPPPARYYVPRLHRYISVDLATILDQQFPDLVACACEECLLFSPNELDYHALMRHSVRCRQGEIDVWGALDPADATDRLLRDHHDFEQALETLQAPATVRNRTREAIRHLPMWARILSTVSYTPKK